MIPKRPIWPDPHKIPCRSITSRSLSINNERLESSRVTCFRFPFLLFGMPTQRANFHRKKPTTSVVAEKYSSLFEIYPQIPEWINIHGGSFSIFSPLFFLGLNVFCCCWEIWFAVFRFVPRFSRTLAFRHFSLFSPFPAFFSSTNQTETLDLHVFVFVMNIEYILFQYTHAQKKYVCFNAHPKKNAGWKKASGWPPMESGLAQARFSSQNSWEPHKKSLQIGGLQRQSSLCPSTSYHHLCLTFLKAKFT